MCNAIESAAGPQLFGSLLLEGRRLDRSLRREQSEKVAVGATDGVSSMTGARVAVALKWWLSGWGAEA